MKRDSYPTPAQWRWWATSTSNIVAAVFQSDEAAADPAAWAENPWRAWYPQPRRRWWRVMLDALLRRGPPEPDLWERPFPGGDPERPSDEVRMAAALRGDDRR